MSVNLRTVYAFAREMYPKLNNTLIEYGTAGFRGKANDLYSCMFRMGVLATLRSRFFGGEVIGVMITASHNPEPDNGVKLIDPRGEMLESSWEVIATRLANISDNEIEEEVARIIKTCGINIGSPSNVFVGMDNRYHSPRLLKAVSDGVIALKGNVREFGIVTTPMMHYFVVAANTKGAYGQPSEEGYYFKLITAFEKVFKMCNDNKKYKNKIIFDGANGVGALKILQFLKRMNGSLEIDVFNKGDGKINEDCGSDYVKINQCIPTGIAITPFERCVSVDGDADRLVYYFLDSSKNFCLLDGDRISILISSYLIELVRDCNLELSLGVVQTAYANGSSTEYIKNQLRIPVACVPTGVKHLHHKAMEFDIGVYFESNGHGTVIFSKEAKSQILNLSNQNISAAKLLTIIDLINETVGDSISDMLLVETILQNKDWDVKEWYATYTDLPNTQLKIKVPDRNVIKTADAERICVEPKGLQDAINTVVLKFAHGRAFARPSGTENIVRVYAEAATKEEADALAHEVCDNIQMFCGFISENENVSETKTANHL